jgi:ribosomal protein S10
MKSKVILELYSSSQKVIVAYLRYLISQFKKLNILFNLCIFPKKKKKLTLLRSPHVFKKAREQFEIIKYKYVLNIFINFPIKYLKLLFRNKPLSLNFCFKKLYNCKD